MVQVSLLLIYVEFVTGQKYEENQIITHTYVIRYNYF